MCVSTPLEVSFQPSPDHQSSSVHELTWRRGYNIGIRLIEDFLARTGLQRCSSFAETAEVISKVSLERRKAREVAGSCTKTKDGQRVVAVASACWDT